MTDRSENAGVERIERLALWLDDIFRIPGTRIRIGLESLIGLVPVIGDAAGLLMGSYVVFEAHRLGAPMELKLKMARNVIVDAVIGLVPVLGDLFDFAFRSNRRNVDLLLGHLRPQLAPPLNRRIAVWLPVLLAIAVGALAAWWLLHDKT